MDTTLHGHTVRYPVRVSGHDYCEIVLPENRTGKSCMGNPLCASMSDAENQTKWMFIHAEDSAWAENIRRDAEIAEQARMQAEAMDDLDGMVADWTPLQRGKAKKALAKKMRFRGQYDPPGGQVLTIREKIKALALCGNLELDIWETGNKKEYLVSGLSLGKTAYLYAAHLQSRIEAAE